MEELTMEALNGTDQTKKDLRLIIKEHLDSKGIKRTWFAEKMFRSPQWVTAICNQEIELTEENRQKAEKVLEIKL